MWDGPRVSSPFHWTHHSKVPIVGSGRTKISAFLATPGHVEKEVSCTRPLGSKRRRCLSSEQALTKLQNPQTTNQKGLGKEALVSLLLPSHQVPPHWTFLHHHIPKLHPADDVAKARFSAGEAVKTKAVEVQQENLRRKAVPPPLPKPWDYSLDYQQSCTRHLRGNVHIKNK